MARIELRDCTVRIKDGLAGTAAINDASPPAENDVTMTIDTVALNTAVTTKVPIGARFTVAGETAADTVHTVTARDPASTGPTTEITFTPALGPGTYLDNGVITFINQQIDIKIGDGNLTYTEHSEYEYMLDRGDLDTVREGNQVPMDVKIDCVYEHITTGTNEDVSPMDALKGIGGAAEWVSASPDLCEPYAVDIEVLHETPCGTAQDETTVFPDFRSETREISLKDATISISGKCNATAPTVTRS